MMRYSHVEKHQNRNEDLHLNIDKTPKNCSFSHNIAKQVNSFIYLTGYGNHLANCNRYQTNEYSCNHEKMATLKQHTLKTHYSITTTTKK